MYNISNNNASIITNNIAYTYNERVTKDGVNSITSGDTYKEIGVKIVNVVYIEK